MKQAIVRGLMLVGTLVGCGGGTLTGPRQTGATEHVVKLGVFLQPGGDGSDELLAVREINEAGGLTIDGEDYAIDLVRAQMGETPDTGVAAVQSMVTQGVVAAVGPRWSSITLGKLPDHSDGAAAAAIAAHLLLVSGSATSAAVTTLGDDDLVWRTVPSDNLQGELAAATAAGALKAKTAAILFRDDAYGKGLASTFATAFEAKGGHVLASKGYDVSGSVNAYAFPELDAVFKDKPDVVYVVTFGEIAQVANRVVQGNYLQAYGATPPSFLSADGAFSDNLLANAPGAVLKRLQGTNPTASPDDPNFKKYAAANALAGFAKPEGNSANLYDAVYCIALAIQAAGSTDAEDFKKAMRAISRDDGGDTTIDVGDWVKAKEALAAGKGIDYQGASGPIDFTAAGDPGRGRFVLWSIVDDGKGFAFDQSKSVSYVVKDDGTATFN
jgi:ABC-type branched-subunit amino acid transport system substrate-binding protein